MLETRLSSRLVNSTTQEERIGAVSQTFAEVIEKDRPFGSLLLKIKQAYTDFLKDLAKDQDEDAGGAQR